MSKHTLGDIHYWTYHDDQATPILMIHGFRGTHHGLEKIAGELPEYKEIIPDLPGFGDSAELADTHSLERYVAEIHTLQQETKARIVLGHSFGSIVAAHYAAVYPDEVDRLILVNPISSPALEGPQAVMTRLAIFYYWLGRKLPENLSAKWLGSRLIVDIMSGTMAVSKDRELRAFIYDQHREYFSRFASSRVVAEAFRTSVEHTVREVTEKLTMPTLVIGAEQDQVSPVATQRAFAKNLPHGTYVELKNVGHLTHYEQPAEVAAAIKKFIQK